MLVKTFPESKMINKVEYNEGLQMLIVEFKNNTKYAYLDVPKSKYDLLLEAQSVGSFITKEIKPNYKFEKL